MGPGSVLSAAIAAHAVPVVDLRDIFRQARQSNIVTSAHDIHCGRFPSLAPVPPRLPVRLLWPLVDVLSLQLMASLSVAAIRTCIVGLDYGCLLLCNGPDMVGHDNTW